MGTLRDQHVDATRRAILVAARRRFGHLGFARTSLDEIAADAGVTKGAVYHHFSSKQHLFLVVYDEIEEELSAAGIAAAAAQTDTVSALQRGFAAFLDRALDPIVQRIALLDAPSVLGTAAKLEVDTRHSFAAVRAGVRAGIDQRQLDELLDPDATAQLLIAACSQAALLIATADDPIAARARAGGALDRLVAGLTP